MTDYIERDLWQHLPDDLPYKASVKRVLIQAPAADVRPVVRGKWEEVTVDMIEDLEFPPTSVAAMFCSNCKRWHNEVYFYGDPTEFVNYCPHCGAEMKILFGGVVTLGNAKLEDADFSLADRIREEGEG